MDEHYAAEERDWSAQDWAAYPDAHFDLVETIAEVGKVVTRVRWTGMHQGKSWSVAPTGKTITVDAMFIHRVADDRITWEGRSGMIDLLSWHQQLGLIPQESPKLP